MGDSIRKNEELIKNLSSHIKAVEFEAKETIELIRCNVSSNTRVMHAILTDTIYNAPEHLLNTLIRNVELLENEFRLSNDLNQDVPNFCLKLIDHCNLAIAQRTFMSRGRLELEQIAQKNKSTEFAIGKLVKDMNSLKDDLKDLSNEYIAILGIFSAIVVTFVGGSSALSAVLEQAAKAQLSKLMVISCATCLFLLDLLGLLFYFIHSLVSEKQNFGRELKILKAGNGVLVLSILAFSLIYAL